MFWVLFELLIFVFVGCLFAICFFCPLSIFGFFDAESLAFDLSNLLSNFALLGPKSFGLDFLAIFEVDFLFFFAFFSFGSGIKMYLFFFLGSLFFFIVTLAILRVLSLATPIFLPDNLGLTSSLFCFTSLE